MQSRQALIAQLRNIIGGEVNYEGTPCMVVELLEEPLCLVLEAMGARTTIQDDQYGSPQRRVTQVFTIPCISEEDEQHLHQKLLSLGLRLD